MSSLHQFNDWYARQDPDTRGLLAQYLAIRRSEGASWPQILQELIAALPNILEFIKGVIALFGHNAAASLVLLLALGGSVTQAAPPPARVAPAARVSGCSDCCTCAPGQCHCGFPGECLYAAAYRVSCLDHKPLVVFVGLPERAVAGCRTVSVPSFPGAAVPSVVVGTVDGADRMARTDLPASADDATIGGVAAFGGRERWASGRCATCR